MPEFDPNPPATRTDKDGNPVKPDFKRINERTLEWNPYDIGLENRQIPPGKFVYATSMDVRGAKTFALFVKVDQPGCVAVFEQLAEDNKEIVEVLDPIPLNVDPNKDNGYTRLQCAIYGNLKLPGWFVRCKIINNSSAVATVVGRAICQLQ